MTDTYKFRQRDVGAYTFPDRAVLPPGYLRFDDTELADRVFAASVEERLNPPPFNDIDRMKNLRAITDALVDAQSLGIGAYYVAPESIYHIHGTARVEYGWLFRPGSLWIGGHYSKANRRWCINLLPMVTFWLCLKGGRRP